MVEWIYMIPKMPLAFQTRQSVRDHRGHRQSRGSFRVAQRIRGEDRLQRVVESVDAPLDLSSSAFGEVRR